MEYFNIATFTQVKDFLIFFFTVFLVVVNITSLNILKRTKFWREFPY